MRLLIFRTEVSVHSGRLHYEIVSLDALFCENAILGLLFLWHMFDHKTARSLFLHAEGWNDGSLRTTIPSSLRSDRLLLFAFVRLDRSRFDSLLRVDIVQDRLLQICKLLCWNDCGYSHHFVFGLWATFPCNELQLGLVESS